MRRIYIPVNEIGRYFQTFSVGQSDQKKLWQRFLFFFSPQLILQKSNGQFQRTLSFSRFQGGGVQHFPGGGVQLLIPYRNPYNLWFSRGGGGVRTPCPSLWIHTWRPWGNGMFLCGSTLPIKSPFRKEIAYMAVYPQIDQLRSLLRHPSKAVKISGTLACLDIHISRFMRNVCNLPQERK